MHTHPLICYITKLESYYNIKGILMISSYMFTITRKFQNGVHAVGYNSKAILYPILETCKMLRNYQGHSLQFSIYRPFHYKIVICDWILENRSKSHNN